MVTGIGWSGTTQQLLDADIDALVGLLATASTRGWDSTLESKQMFAWRESLGWLQQAAAQVTNFERSATTWGWVLEFEIPRRGYKIDAVCLADGVVVPIEFKSSEVDSASIRQVEDYGLELSDFHKGSNRSPISPILCSGGADLEISAGVTNPNSQVADVSITPPSDLARTLTSVVRRDRRHDLGSVELGAWVNASYEPTPTIIEAATALYAGHQVQDLTRSEASAAGLAATENAIRNAIDSARKANHKIICFITGVPGAGKTLAGLNVVNAVPDVKATYLSGNGPLVKILSEALAVDHHGRDGTTLSKARRRSSTFVTNVHRWLAEYIDRNPDQAPLERLAVFDEAQRAWSSEHSKRKFGRDASEPEMMLTAMDRHADWAVIVALVGGGQEINTGEAGLGEWGRALETRFRHWQVAVSPDLLAGQNTTAGSMLFETVPEYLETQLTVDPDLHLSVSQRSFRTTHLNGWVEAVLANEPEVAASISTELENYPLAITRDLDASRNWLKSHARGLRRSGLVASSGARRLRPHGINVRERIDEADWFLRDKTDVRSSDFLELAATEFGIQGLELDWIGLCWGGDFRRVEDEWVVKQFAGTTWRNVNQAHARDFVLNRYRVLLTRAREGLIVWVPTGSSDDTTRGPEIYDEVYEYLKACGMSEIKSASDNADVKLAEL